MARYCNAHVLSRNFSLRTVKRKVWKVKGHDEEGRGVNKGDSVELKVSGFTQKRHPE